MRKYFSEDDLYNFLDDESAWRKRELYNHKELLKSARDSYMETYIRAATTAAYAHWEGFVKNACSAYVTFINSQNLKGETIHPKLAVIYLHSRITDPTHLRSLNKFSEFVEFTISKMQTTTVTFDPAKLISTRSNLKYDVFEEIFEKLNIETTKYSTKQVLIDKLVDSRNHIAHGQKAPVDVSIANQNIDEIIALITNVKTDIENSTALKSYLLKSMVTTAF